MNIKKIEDILKAAYRKIIHRKTAAIILSSCAVKTEQMKEYEKRFEPKPPEPDPLKKTMDELAVAQKPEQFRHFANNWRKMHGLTMRRKKPKIRSIV